MSLFGGGGSKPGLSINTGAANLFGGNTTTQQPAAAGGGLFGGSASATTKPAATSLFGAAPAAGASSTAGTLFGAGTANATTGAPSLFGNATATSAPSAAGALFGGTAAAAKPAGGLFGASTTTTSAPAGGSLFGGATANPTATPAAGGGLFGANTGAAAGTGSSLFGAPKPATTGLFGNTTTTTAATNTSGLFGTTNTGGGLFGNSTTNTGGGLFGGTTQQAAAPQASNLFGASAQNTSSGLFGANNNPIVGAAAPGLGLGQTARPGINQPQPAAPQQTQRSIFNSSIGSFTAATATVPGVRVDASNLRPTTRFADLHEVLQQELERLDLLILQQQMRAEECQQAQGPVRDALAYVPGDADFCAAKLTALQSALQADAAAIDALKRATRACADDAKVSFRNISALRAPSAYGGSGVVAGTNANPGADPGAPAHAQGIPAPVPAGLLDGGDEDGDDPALSSSMRGGRDLANYMNRQVIDMDKKLARFRAGLGEVESYLASVEAGTVARAQSAQLRTAEGGRGRRSADDQVRELAAVLRDMEGGILAVAAKVGQAREMSQQTIIDESRLRGRLGPLY